MASSPVAPPVVELGRLAGWSPLPLSVRDARRASAGLRQQLVSSPRPSRPVAVSDGAPVTTARGLVVRYGDTVALRGLDLTVRAGEIVALMGRNGAGKSTLLRCLVGLTSPESGSARVDDHDPATLRPPELVRRVALVPQVPADLLYADSVGEECASADRDAGATPGTSASLLSRLAPDVGADVHPRDLSEGQRLALALTVVLATRPPLLLLDEPTRGLDYTAKGRLTAVLRDLAGQGHAVVLATHDVELVADLADRTVVLAEGEVVADGPTADVITASPVFAPQVAKILAPQPWLTVREVAQAMEVA
jgi:energy-coupling factor transport system ATP-binding protein